MSSCNLKGLLLILICCSSVFSKATDEFDDQYPGEIIIVTAERMAVSELESPYTTVVIDQDKIRNSSYRSTVEILRDVPGVLLQKTSHGQGSPYIRGFTGFRTLFLIDGIRLNNSILREGPNQYWNTVDPYSIATFEVVKGPTSVVYGSDAIGGTVNAISSLQSLDDDSLDTPFNFLYRGSTAGQSNIIRTQLQTHISQDSALSLGLTGKKFGDIIAGGNSGKLANTGYDEFNLDAKLLNKISDNWLSTSGFFHTNQNNVPRTHKTIYSESFAGTTVGSDLKRDLDQRRSLIYTRLTGQELNSFADNTQITLSYHQQEESRDRLRTRDRSDQQGISVDTIGFSSQFYSQFIDSGLNYGIEYYRDSVNSFSTKSDIQGPVADDALYEWFGLYGQNKYKLSEQLLVDIGLRWNYINVDARKVNDPTSDGQISISDNWSNLVGNLRLNYQLKPDETSLFVGLSQGFRAPNLSDLSRFDSARSNEFEIASPGLKPEHYLILDWGIKHRTENYDYDFSLYYTDISDQIQRVPTGNVNADNEFEISKVNLGDGYAYGGEFDLKYRFNSHLNMFANFAYINGKVDTFPDSSQQISREYMSRLMPTNGRIGVEYNADSGLWWLSSELVAFDRADRLSSRDKNDTQRIPAAGTPGFVILNIRASYYWSDSVLMSLSVENLLDKNYRVHGSGQNEMGVNAIFSLNINY